MSARRNCPLCGHHLPDDSAPSILEKPLTDSVKYMAFLNFCKRHDLPRLGRQETGDGEGPRPGYFFLKVPGHADLFLKDSLAFGSAAEIVNELATIAKLDGLYLNSSGGALVEAWKLYAALKGKTPVAIVHSCCASSALLVAFAADKILIDPQAQMGCHPVCGAVMGNSLDLRKTALQLDLATEQLVEIIKARTGQPESVVRDWLNPEKGFRFFSAQEAVNVGLADGFFELPPPAVIAEK
jgi:ATP-dependent protease ClpP protease subunit